MNLLAFKLSNLLSLIIFIIIICFIIAWHELGHLLTAKKCNVYCYEYSIGFGPAIYINKKHETYFCLRAIPLGGFVKMAGEDGENLEDKAKDNNGNIIPSDRLLTNKKRRERALVLAAGGIMNLILALVCFYFYVSFNPLTNVTGNSNDTGFICYTTNQMTISEGGQLEEKGLISGDKIIKLAIDGKEYDIDSYIDLSNALNENAISEYKESQEVIVYYTRNGKDMGSVSVYREGVYKLDAEGNYLKDDDGNKIVTSSMIGVSPKYYKYNALTGIYGAFHYFGYYTVELFKALGELFTGNFENVSSLVGIYGTVNTLTTSTSISTSLKILDLVYFAGAISFSLGIFNLIPFPALDGGRLFFLAIEGIRKKKLNPNVEATINLVGIIILFAFMIIVNIKDIVSLFR